MDDFIKSAIGSYETILEHYDFVIADLKSEIYNADMQASKAPVISFLQAIRDAYGKSLEDMRAQAKRGD